MGENYNIVEYDIFRDKLNKLPDEFKKQIDKIKVQLRLNPYVGKPIGTRWKREKKIGGKRIYYIIFEIEKKVELVDISNKKDQQKIIDKIKQIWLFFLQ